MLLDGRRSDAARVVKSVGEIAIRPYDVADALAVWQAARESLADLTPWMPWSHPAYSLDESRAWLEAQVQAFKARTAFEFAITSVAGAYLGGCGLSQLDAANRRANLGYWVRSTAVGRGVATAAVGLVREWAFENTDLMRLEIVVAAGNRASQRVAEKAGATREGLLRKRLVLHGETHDALIFSLTR